MSISMEKKYPTALYLKLSRGDNDMNQKGKSESNSIVNQRTLLEDYINNHKEFELVEYFIDDGWSGSNFDRPEFKNMIQTVNDNYDTLTANSSESSVIMPVKNLINDSFCKDISTKVGSSQQTKRLKGEFIGAFAVYGYRKSSENKNQLVVDEYAADIVKEIFAKKLNGMSASAIANILNKTGCVKWQS